MPSRPVDQPDADVLLAMFEHRSAALNLEGKSAAAMRAYWAGAIESHCAQNAIDMQDLEQLATAHGHKIDWTPHILLSGVVL